MSKHRISPKQDAFARNVAMGMNILQAATQANYANPANNAYRLMESDGINKAIAKYKHEFGVAVKEQQVTPDSIMRNATEIASQRENLGAAVAALRLQADVLGMLGGGQRDLPDAARELMSALGEGLARGNVRRTEALEVEPTETRELGSPEEPEDQRTAD